MTARSNIGVDVVRRWSECLPPGSTVVDVGCGSGVPISAALIARGFRVFGIDASPTLVSAFRQRFPQAEVACESAEGSRFFDRKFDGAVAIGLLFLLPATDQLEVIERVASALEAGGRFLFTAPREACEWNDMLTGQPSLSLGMDEYRRILERAGMQLRGSYVDEGENHYFDAAKTGA
ncbi:MAG: class I SAM-dependent methyltransferase [Deltaproteobacteria bacterium]|nr:class I SAM-dependent methyltransferase [Deltaproteobacteria bacterium]